MAAYALPAPPTPQSGGLAPEALNGNSLTQRIRALLNYLQSQGQQTYGYGQSLVGAGADATKPASDTAGTALGTTGTALGTTTAADEALSPAMKYWQGVLAGGPEAQAAIAPTATQISKNLTGALSTVDNMPRGGYSASLRASLPTAAAGQVNTALLNLQPTAATNLNTIANTKNAIAGTQNNIAGTQTGVGSLQAQIAQLLGQLGLGVMGQGSGLLGQANSGASSMRGQDVNEHGQALSLAGQLAGDASQGYIANLKP